MSEVVVPANTIDDCPIDRIAIMRLPSTYEEVNVNISRYNMELVSTNKKQGLDVPLLPPGSEDHLLNFKRQINSDIYVFNEVK